MTFTVSKYMHEYLNVVCCITHVFDAKGISASKMNIM